MSWLALAAVVVSLLGSLFYPLQPTSAAALTWRMGYYPGYEYTNMPMSATDFNGLTHLAHFALEPQSDGTVTQPWFTPAQISDVVSTAHSKGVKVLIVVGGANSGTAFNGAIQSANRTAFVNNLYNFMTTNGYDGIDLDAEPITDSASYQAFVTELRTKIGSAKLLTAAIGSGDGNILAPVANKFDQINVMTYDMSGAWPQWVTWFNSPLYNGGYTFPSTGGAVPSLSDSMNALVNAGISKSKLGIGISFGSHIWSGGAGTDTGGVSKPKQSWTTAPSDQYDIPYKTIMGTYYSAANDHWDSTSMVPWLGFDNSGSANDMFISYENAESIRQKVIYAQNNGFGGAIIWEIAHDYMPSSADQHPLMTGLRDGLTAGSGGIGTNLLSNPGFESGTTGWTDWGNSSVVASNAHSGASSLRSGTAAGGKGQTISTGVTAGASYTLSGWGKLSASGGSNYGSLSYTCYNASGMQLASGNVAFTTTSYTQKSVTFTAPANTATIQVGVWAGGSSYYFYQDDISFVKN